jgi:hypothetical protein
MDPSDVASTIAEPLGAVAGAAFYFGPESTAQAVSAGVDVVTLYAAGRGGVMGDASPAEVDEVFFFFKPGLIAGVIEAGRATADPAAILGAHLAAADDYAHALFDGIDPAALAGFARAASAVFDGLPTGAWPLVDGYRRAVEPADPTATAFRGAILLRELRGGVHRDAVVAAGLTGAIACQFDRGDDYYRLHGYGDEDRVPGTPEVLAARAAAVEATDARMGGFLSVLDDAGLQALVDGALAMAAALDTRARAS